MYQSPLQDPHGGGPWQPLDRLSHCCCVLFLPRAGGEVKYSGLVRVIRFLLFSCECNEPRPAEGPARSAAMTFAALASHLGVVQQRDIWTGTG